MRSEYGHNKMMEKNRIEHEQQEAERLKLEKRMLKQFMREGRTQMLRSQKKAMKKKEKKVVMDEDTANMLKYVGMFNVQ
jgi:hypothetical protein